MSPTIRRLAVALAVVAVARLPLVWAQPAAPLKPPEVVKAESLFREGKIDDALKQLQDAVKKHPQLSPPRLMLARLYFNAGEIGPGRAQLEQAAVETPNHPEIYLQNASQAMAEGRMTDGILNCQTALAKAASDQWSAEQKKSFQREAQAGLATAFEARSDWESARTHLLAWLEIEPKSGSGRQRLARALFMLGKDTEALNELNQAVKDDPTLEPAELVMGRLWSMKGNPKQTEEWFQKAAEKHPKDARVHRVFGGWLLDRGRVDGAKVHIETALKLEPKSTESRGLKGVLERYQKHHDEAIKIFEDLARDEPGNFYINNHLALSCAEVADKQKRAVQVAEMNARQYPRLAEAQATLGWTYFKSGRLDEADRALSAAASGGQISSDIAYYMACVLKDRGKKDEAKDLLKRALESDGPFINRADAKALLDGLAGSK